MTGIELVALGVDDVERAARFWSATLGYRRRAPRYPGDEWVVLEPLPGSPGVPVSLDPSESPAPDFPRLHLDLGTEDDLEQEVARLVALGAERVDWPHYPEPGREHPSEPRYVVLADPERNRFCLVDRSGARGG